MISIGVDEVGRGAWAGPLLVVAVALDLNMQLPKLQDSKKLSESKRVHLDKIIKENAQDIAFSWISSMEIDRFGLGLALRKAMKTAVAKINCKFERIIVDGTVDYIQIKGLSKAVVRADDKFPEVSCASIVAKTARDSYMRKKSSEYQEYGFDKHVGYGTRQHLEALKKHGPIENFHRFSFKPVSELAK